MSCPDGMGGESNRSLDHEPSDGRSGEIERSLAARIALGEQQILAGETVTHEVAKQRLQKWLA